MLAGSVDLQFGKQAPPQPILRQHPSDSGLNQALRLLLAHFPRTNGADPARVTGMAMIQFGLGLGTGEPNLGGIDNDHKIAAILMGREIGPMFPAQNPGRT
jgi:hypothetical protein